MLPPFWVILVLFTPLFLSLTSAVDFLYNSFAAADTSPLNLTDDARLEPPFIRLTNDSNQFSLGRAFYPSRIPFKSNSNSTNITTVFSTQFVFSVLPEISSSPGFGLAFVLSASTSPPNALSGQYFGLFSGSRTPTVAPLLAIEFDTGRNPEFNDPDGNHVGIDLNNIESVITQTAGYYTNNSGNFSFVPVAMRNGQNIHAWVEFNGPRNEINVTIAPAGMARPVRTMLSYRNPAIANYCVAEMFIGFSASKTQWVEAQRVLAWSFSDTGVARDINTTGLPVFLLESSGSSLSRGAIAGIAVGSSVAFVIALGLLYWFWLRRKEVEENDRVEDWEMEYWPHRFSFEELREATKGLNRWIFDKPKKLMDWEGRRRVLADVAEGLNYLHHGWDQVVVHRDIKSSNVLLDSDMRGRLGDFGLAKLYAHGEVPNTTRVVGTFGYLAPEVATQASPTAAGDVYSFGVVVLEVACGRRPIQTAVEREEEEKYIKGRLLEAADERIKGQYEVEEMEAILKLGLACCHPNPLHRPTMGEVVAILIGDNVSVAPKDLLSELTPMRSNTSEDGENEEQ
ncbi:unnamed protein product [Fraxinus pennsylvanica]|uniref:non-specific serine/threonine protein kinase n=1 Tax=Fraxinus pennsylvanica TaxID=56036 RepID=A0AAD1YSB1_9LAMI|nr:unnamed protein product [Fraxinus pennsylvanica]